MKLINSKTHLPLVEFNGKKTVFYNKFLEKEMKTLGIPIPNGLRGIYHGKDNIYLGEEEFQLAFKEIYFVTRMDPSEFHWVSI